MKLSKSYIQSMGTFSAAIAFLSILAFATILKPYFSVNIPIAFIFIVFSSVMFHKNIVAAKSKQGTQFNTAFVAALSAKLLGSLFFVLLFLVIYKKEAMPFVLYFITLYFIFLFFEIKLLLKEIKTKKEE